MDPLQTPDLSRIRPLDLMFFCKTDLFSEIISEFEDVILKRRNCWSHVGVVINREIVPDIKVEDDDLYLWESTLSEKHSIVYPGHAVDIESGKPILGVQIRRLKDVISDDILTKSTVAWGKLIHNPVIKTENETYTDYQKRIEWISQRLCKVHDVYYHRMYEINLFRLLGSVLPSYKWLRNKLCFGKNYVFCSELVAIVYKSIHIYPDELEENIVNPEDIIEPELCPEKIPVSIEPLIIISPDYNKLLAVVVEK